MGASVVKAEVLVLDCSEPEKLAEFYRQFLDAEVVQGPGSDRLEIIGAGGTHMAFRRDLNATPPSWPRPDDSYQFHLDFLVGEEDIDEAERQVVSLGARPMDTKDTTGPYEVRRYADPAGHPFSLRCSLVSGPKTS